MVVVLRVRPSSASHAIISHMSIYAFTVMPCLRSVRKAAMAVRLTSLDGPDGRAGGVRRLPAAFPAPLCCIAEMTRVVASCCVLFPPLLPIAL